MSSRRVLSKKGKTILIISIVIGVLVVGGSGFLLWRVNQEKSLSTDEIDASYSDCVDSLGYVKSGCLRCQCEDGAWVVGKGSSCWTLCRDMVHNKPPSTSEGYCIQGSQCPACEWPQVAYCGCSADTTPAHNTCGCRKYNDFTCGVACGTVQSCTPNSCPSGWEDCGTSGTSSAKAEGCVAKTSCEGKCSGCSNKFVVKRYCKPEKENVCDGGGWTTQVPQTVEKGESVNISGYGKDSDGVDPTSVEILVDGESVGNGNATVSTLDTTKTKWSYTISGLEEGKHTVTISWKDNKGLGGSLCTLTSTFSVKETIITNPNWEIQKIGTPVCKEGVTDELDYVEVVYVITITNTGNGEGEIENIVDTLDSKVGETFVEAGSITGLGKYSNGKLTWTLSEEDMFFDPGESKTYMYKLSVPRSSFGTYINTVVATPTTGDSFSTTATIQTDCSLIPDIPDVPETGIFDGAWRKIALGFGFLALGMLYMKIDFIELVFEGSYEIKRRTERRKKKFNENRVFSIRKRFERRVKK